MGMIFNYWHWTLIIIILMSLLLWRKWYWRPHVMGMFYSPREDACWLLNLPSNTKWNWLEVIRLEETLPSAFILLWVIQYISEKSEIPVLTKSPSTTRTSWQTAERIWKKIISFNNITMKSNNVWCIFIILRRVTHDWIEKLSFDRIKIGEMRRNSFSCYFPFNSALSFTVFGNFS